MGYDPSQGSEILNAFIYGFLLHYTGARMPRDAKNLKSASTRPEIVGQNINAEIETGRVAGPFDQRPLLNLHVFPWVWFQNKRSWVFPFDSPLTYPSGDSVNDFIDPNLCSVEYTSFDAAVYMIQDLCQGCLLGKSDISNAFRLLPISPHEYDQLGSYFEGNFYFDKVMPFGCSIACRTSEVFATFLEFCVS